MMQNTNINGLDEMEIKDMHFASHEFFDYMRQEINNPDGVSEMYTKLAMVLKQDVSYRIFCKVPEQDREDVFIDVYVDVHKGLVEFLNKPQSAESSDNRGAWLRHIVKAKIADYYLSQVKPNPHKPSMTEEEILAKMEEARQIALDKGKSENEIEKIMLKVREKCLKNTSKKIPLVWDPEGNVEMTDTEHTPEKMVIPNDANPDLAKLVKSVSDMKTGVDKRIAYIFSNYIIPMEWGEHISGKPSVTAERLSGMTLFETFEQMNKSFKDVYNIEFPKNTFSAIIRDLCELDRAAGLEKLVGDKMFDLSAEQISLACCRIDKKLYSKDKNGNKVLNITADTKSRWDEGLNKSR